MSVGDFGDQKSDYRLSAKSYSAQPQGAPSPLTMREVPNGDFLAIPLDEKWRDAVRWRV